MKRRTGLGLSIVFMAVLLFISGCNNNNVQKVYFVDAFVVGLEYDCGRHHGKTDENGSFNYGGIGDCSFHLGELSFNASQESMQKGYITPYDVTETPEEAHVLSAILHYVSFDAHNRMILLDEATKKINDYPLDRGDESIIGALGIEETDSYIHVNHAKRLLSKYVNRDNTLKYDIFTMTSGSGDIAGDLAGDFALQIGKGMLSELGGFAASQIFSAIGIPGFSNDDGMSQVTEKLDQLSKDIAKQTKEIEAILSDFDVLFGEIDTSKYNDFSLMYSDTFLDSANINDTFRGITWVDGNYSTLDNYTPTMCKSLENKIFDPVVQLTTPSNSADHWDKNSVLDSFSYWHNDLIGSLKTYFSVKQAYLSLIMPEVGNDKNVTGFIGLIDQYNENVLQVRLNVMLSVQRLIQLHQTALYLTSNKSKCTSTDFDIAIPSVQSISTVPLVYGHDYNASLADLENYYQKFLFDLSDLFDSQMISDPIEGKNYMGSTYDSSATWISAVDSNFTKHTAGTAVKHLPDGEWKKSCLIYQYYGFSDLNATIRGDYNGHYLHHAYCKGNELSPDKYTLSPPFEPDFCNDGGSEAGLYKGNLGCEQDGYMQAALNQQPYEGITFDTSRDKATAMYILHMEIQDSTLIPKFGQKKFQAESLQNNENVGTVLQNDQNIYRFFYGNLRNVDDVKTFDNSEVFSLSNFTNGDSDGTNVSSVASSRFKIRFSDLYYYKTEYKLQNETEVPMRTSKINIQCLEAPSVTSSASECHEIATNLLCINDKDLLKFYQEDQDTSHIIYFTDERLNPSESLCSAGYYEQVLNNTNDVNVYNNYLLTQSEYK